jgi:NADP-dependent 3-hydroxy acid dehydrogenase YdfG
MPARQNILITGASAGLGMGMARQFAAMGRNVVLCARRTDRLTQLRTELPGARVFALDVNDHSSVFEVFRAAQAELGTIDRVIVNAGRSKGQPVGTGSFAVNADILETNLVAALAQTEAAMELFREQNSGHLVVISSVAAVRGFPGGLAVYSASKAGIAVLAEGLRLETGALPIKVTTIYPGYIRTSMNAGRKVPFVVDTDRGCRMLAQAIEREPATAFVPGWPWTPIGTAMRYLPLGLLKRLQARIYRR